MMEKIINSPLHQMAIDDPCQKFSEAMQAVGICYFGEIIPDGCIHRFHIDGHKCGTRNGAYILHVDRFPAGWFMDFTTGFSQTWRSGNARNVSFSLSAQIKAAKKQREIEIFQKHTAAAQKAKQIWGKSKAATQQCDHPYLMNKCIRPIGVRIYGKALVIPIRNESGQLINLQFINSKGEKRFLSGGRKLGCFHIIGTLTDKILVCEGYATGASLHAETAQRVIVAFDAGNLLPVAKNIRKLSPKSEIIVCGDNDLSNVGQTKARAAALAVNGKILIPKIPGKDWNDLVTVTGGCKHG